MEKRLQIKVAMEDQSQKDKEKERRIGRETREKKIGGDQGEEVSCDYAGTPAGVRPAEQWGNREGR